ncbi:ECF transporter S component [Isoptericola sp. b490]|uniref:ECF transporter S component n=1 Tax=Actinotalea lenta TaxID=3064654 RepID=UPI002712C776|nr:ECF transporter S component [Isoptericola sp. b490]MDO8120606.1 ECF transporter S component [Isoptericola sp. b490]
MSPRGRAPDRAQWPEPAIQLRSWSTAALALSCAVGLAAFCWPLLVAPGAGLAHATDAPLILGAVLACVLVVVHLALVDGGMDVKAVALLGLLSAVGAALRPLSAGTAGVELVFTVLVLGGRVLGAGFGFALGATTLGVSALLTGGVGPWLPFQMLGAAWVGLGAGLLPRAPRGRLEVAMLAGYGAVAAFVYGTAMNLSFWPFTLGADTALSFVPGAPLGDNLRRLLAFTAATSLGWDLGRAVTTAVGVALVGAPVIALLRRAASRARFATPEPRHAEHRATRRASGATFE